MVVYSEAFKRRDASQNKRTGLEGASGNAGAGPGAPARQPRPFRSPAQTAWATPSGAPGSPRRAGMPMTPPCTQPGWVLLPGGWPPRLGPRRRAIEVNGDTIARESRAWTSMRHKGRRQEGPSAATTGGGKRVRVQSGGDEGRGWLGKRQMDTPPRQPAAHSRPEAKPTRGRPCLRPQLLHPAAAAPGSARPSLRHSALGRNPLGLGDFPWGQVAPAWIQFPSHCVLFGFFGFFRIFF